MKKLFIAIFLLFGCIGIIIQSHAQKVLESSEKRAPEWVNGLVKEYIIVTASSPTLDDAQQKALAKVKEQIISSVAENIQTSSEYFRSEKINNNNSDFAESFQTATKTRAADIPFIKGISLTNVEAFYWEKVEIDKKAKTFNYYYHIKYPFSQQQLKTLILEFEKADRALTEQLESLLAKIDVMTNLEEMGQTAKELEALGAGFIDVDPRKDKANVGVAKIREMLKNVGIETISTTLGEVKLALKIGEKLVTTSRKPTVRSKCAKIVDIRSKTPEWIITYSYDECYEDPDNAINVEFLNAYGKAKGDYFFNINAEKIEIFVNNDINISGGTESEGSIANAKCQISITSKYATPFEIEKVILNFGNEAPIIADGINKSFNGEGKHDIEFTISQSLAKDIYSAKVNPLIKGTIHYKSSKSGEKLVYKMYNQKITTSW
jgi:hypothetical protein